MSFVGIHQDEQANEKRKEWKKGKDSFLHRVGFLNFWLLCLFTGLVGLVIIKVLVEYMLINQLFVIQNLGHQLYVDQVAIASLIMNAKDYFLSPDSFSLLDSGYFAGLLNNISSSIDFTADTSSVTQATVFLYNGFICSSVNMTVYNSSINCSTYYSGLLNNGIDSIKNILKSSLNFVFVNSTSVNYNTTQDNIVNLDLLNDIIANGIGHIFNQWQIGFLNYSGNYNSLLILFSVLICVVMILAAALWAVCLRKKLLMQYTYARRVFSNLVPSDTLNLNKLIKVQLIKAEIMK